MLDTQNPLIAEFLHDHQQMSRLLYSIAELLKSNKVDQAREKARELDALAGPHIAYEESELYPRLAALGEKRATPELLVGQHHEVLNAIKQLLSDEPLDDQALTQVIDGIQVGLDHAEHCGSLISLMSRLSADQQEESLRELRRFRTAGQKWTELN